ncbi:transmembrane protein 26-like isoform X1 [Sphaeramia orbicularis]|uniref:transmembrane protein 26-like isoform X2 n=1 Tax=Sphaeramia orbicularis TaxID=375764 RepID=UPI001180D5DF|nr:transmembrane protein 26-like isoform X2 [Sphaeramia orbicularis]XP_030018965.1 transmembrane protein 26-like isoform X1 [Sphaeramia orbicularis]
MFFKFICAVVTRLLFILVSLIGVWRVVRVKENGLYWCLTILYLPLVVEMILTLRRRRGHDCKWFSPAIFLFLISIIPSLWILELHHQENKGANPRCVKLDSTETFTRLFRFWNNSANNTEQIRGVPSLSLVCANDWILALHQILLILLILGKWLLPASGVLTRNQLSQLLLIFVGTAADILEFTSETLSDIKDSSPSMVYIILAVWTWSMLQFPLHFSVMEASSDDLSEPASSPSVLSNLRADIWSTAEALFIQDGPFLLVRLTVMIYFNVVHQMLIFFAIKNFLVVILNIYRLSVLICDTKAS